MIKPLKLAPSVLAANFKHLEKDIKDAEAGGADLLHIDVMDGMFVPNISFGALIVNACKESSDLHRDVHLMIEKPERYLNDFIDAGAQTLTIHAEATPHVHRALQQIKEHGVRAGLAVNPLTPLTVIKDALPYLDQVLIMSVNPGFGGQSFIQGSLERLRSVKSWIDEAQLDIDIEVDGGVDEHSISDIVKAGANVLVAGSAVFKSNASIQERIGLLKEKAANTS